AVPLVVVPGVTAGVVAARSSTGAASCVGVLEQPAMTVATNAAMINLRMMSPDRCRVASAMDSARKGSPCGLAEVGCWPDEPLLHAAVRGNCSQYTTPSLLGSVDDQFGIR